MRAEAMLQAATTLEDLLSDLRYLDQAPSMDGSLTSMLEEAGELLSSTMETTGPEETAIATVRPTLERLTALREQIKAHYIPDWNELAHVHQEFATQGFSLVIIDLEIVLDQLSAATPVSEVAQQTAQETLSQLIQIGTDLQLADDWFKILERCQTLAQSHDSQLWCQAWPPYFHALKTCAKQSGKYNLNQLTSLDKQATDSAVIGTIETTQPSPGPAQSESDEMLLDNAIFSSALDNLSFLDMEANLDFDIADLNEI
ncbi:MAG: hybrid sensor histidine kinase/response regulator, partial [Cyanobacteria bacterium P01_F01_bin.42]